MKGDDEETTDSVSDAGQSEVLSRPMDELVGSRALEAPEEALFLLRLKDGRLSPELAQALGTQSYSPQLPGDFEAPPLVLGPLRAAQIREWVLQKKIDLRETALRSFDRWKPLAVLFPDLSTAFDTRTEELTHTNTLGEEKGFAEGSGPGATHTPTPPDDKASDGEVITDPGVQSPAGARLRIRESTQVQSGPAPTPPRERLPGPVAGSQRSEWFKLAAGLGLLLMVGGAYQFLRRHNFFLEAESPLPQDPSAAREAASSTPKRQYPEKLRPLPTETLFNDDPALVHDKLRPVLNAYERGATVLTENDEKTLRTLADPAASSWEARRLAANQLAIFLLSAQRVAEAKKVLLPIFDASPSDPTTLLNISLIHLVDGDTKGARENAAVGLRLSPPGMAWIGSSILGMIESAAGRLDEAEKNFTTALSRSANNPFIYGMWMQSLFRADPAGKGKIPHLVREALSSDPDRLIDSPMRAPLGGHIIMAESLEGFKKAAEFADAKLRPGQIAFIRWLEARSRFNPLAQSLAQTLEQLANENDPTSQLLYAYALTEQNRINEASEVLSRLLPASGARFAGSWPWTFAGDVQCARGQLDAALSLYQEALSRNPQDTAAVLGLGIAYREKGDFVAAEQKMNEALALDPLFVPALLRVDRLEWHRRYRSK